MFDGTHHRKRVKHYEGPRTFHELTWSCVEHKWLLDRAEHRGVVMDAIQRSTERLGYATLAFVVMPNHAHLLVRPLVENYSISDLLYAIKKPSSFQIKRVMEQTGDPRLPSLFVEERPGKTVFRLWQEGPGYDRNPFDDRLNASARYIHLNPVRKGLCARAEDWEWSSARWYAAEALRPDGGIEW